ncbi:phosphopantothenoylcysteine decarboxylase/phosphopantothenate/cysteine ligase [Thioalkalivibrio sp. K90mix]|uniref:bifunctional phosphopantothenoylcysteine decarboxylase/phosphopantothenate--cysteine ligase CoaBC n=1 Tax=Thioalkalivibrio sp. (strain K90mix) TaxID=396595 RepID=UPI0001959D55|nr:bifunctional phosphopantothenoylcysteine decarboxylase/phosphopantothenate--cysteine ligase CoaBC [Thioalkalivibrio sp. K90mix]ADC72749.1 phosphopantothenoylcysteine decarboxylase/phosphopantothenate/cysteine ligase [Thioalkalivibrio sp. K90mix]
MTEHDSKPRILVGVSGGIAAYKACELVRELRRAGCEVRVVMTAGAQAFVTPLTFQALSGAPVRTELLDAEAESGMDHIALARWAERIVVAPASANLIARFAQGLADDLLSTLLLATTAPVALAPAMNHRMWAHPATQANIATLVERGVTLIGPDSGDQACGEQGEGRLREPAAIARELLQPADVPLAGRHVLITAGPTFEPIDPVRFIGNRSSGRMGFALAAAAREAGARVTLVHGPTAEAVPAGIKGVATETAAAMHAAVMERLPETDILIAAAAVADYRPAEAQTQKIKKAAPVLNLTLERTEDILAEAASHAATLPRRPFLVGFAAETEQLREHAEAKRRTKAVDLIAANRVGEGLAFGTADNELLCIWEGGERTLPNQPKTQLARALIDLVIERLAERETD